MRELVELARLAIKGLKLATVREPEKKPDIRIDDGNRKDSGVMGSRIPKLSFEEGRWYTKKQTIKNIIAVEDHFRSGMCSACLLEKHLPALEMYAEEGLSYCVDYECRAYKKLKDLVRETEKILLEKGVPDEKERIELAEKFRQIRKELSGYDVVEEAFGEGPEVGDEQAG